MPWLQGAVERSLQRMDAPFSDSFKVEVYDAGIAGVDIPGTKPRGLFLVVSSDGTAPIAVPSADGWRRVFAVKSQPETNP